MKSRILVAGAVLAAALTSFSVAASAQTSRAGENSARGDRAEQQTDNAYSSRSRVDSSVWSRGSIVALEVGRPGIFGPKLLIPVGDRGRVGGMLTFLPDLNSVGAEYRYDLSRPGLNKIGVNAGFGATYYWVSSDKGDANPIGFHAMVGFLFPTESRLVFGGDVGYQKTTGDEGDDPVKKYGVRKGLSAAIVNFKLGYLF